MIGFNIPAFKILDVLSIEVERYTNKFPNDWEMILEKTLPLPYLGDTSLTPYRPEDYVDDDIKWSVNFKKELIAGLSIYGQVARDHLRTLDIYWRMEEREALQKKGHWYYLFNFVYGF
jgi:hypothetical protein